jgi:hypothetical protein
MSDRTPAQLYSLVFGAILLLVGIVGFLVDASFNFGSSVEGQNLIAFEVNGTHNLVHIASGAIGLAVWRNASSARLFALGFGVVYLLVTLLGFVQGDNVLGLLPVNAADNILHLLIAAAGIGAGLASRTGNAAVRTA